MGFMTSYKRLDNLCKDMNGIGVTGYIDDVEKIKAEIFSVPNWKDDYYKLKHYRYIRNRIAHDNNADEETLCSPKDIAWIENFHQHILNRTDPLSLYYKSIKLRQTPKKAEMPKTRNVSPTYQEQEQELKKKKIYRFILTTVISAVVVIGIIFYIFFS